MRKIVSLLRQLGQGRSLQESAEIIGIAVSTASSYLDGARRRRQDPSRALVLARAISRGQLAIDEALGNGAQARIPKVWSELDASERAILKAVVSGIPYKRVGTDQGCSPDTIKNRVKRLKSRFRIASKNQFSIVLAAVGELPMNDGIEECVKLPPYLKEVISLAVSGCTNHEIARARRTTTLTVKGELRRGCEFFDVRNRYELIATSLKNGSIEVSEEWQNEARAKLTIISSAEPQTVEFAENLGKGLTNPELAKVYGVSINVVRKRVSALYRLLSVRHREDVVRLVSLWAMMDKPI